MILITGATGTIGGELARLLAARGVKARTLHRSAGDAAGLSAMGHEPIQAALDDREALTEAMRGCDTLFLLSPPVQEQERWEANAISAAKAAGLVRIVKVSAADANLSSRVPWTKAHASSELAVRASGLRYTILRPTAFKQNFLEMAAPPKRGYLPIPAGSGHAAFVDARDVALVAERVLREEGHDRATYVLTGPEAMTMEDAAKTLSQALGRRIRYLNLPAPIYKLFLRVAGLDRRLANALVAQYAGVVAGGHVVAATEEVERLTGGARVIWPHSVRKYEVCFETAVHRAFYKLDPLRRRAKRCWCLSRMKTTAKHPRLMRHTGRISAGQMR